MELHPQPSAETQHASSRTWQALHPEECSQLTDSRLQFHHAVQFAASTGISFLTPRPDDSHTNLEWLPNPGGLFSRVVAAPTPFRVGVTPADFTLRILIEGNRPHVELKLHGQTVTDATEWLRHEMGQLGADASRYNLKRHYEIPHHDVEIGESFDASNRSHFAQLTRWFSNAALILNSVARHANDASEVRCWPHNFDIATLLSIGTDRTIGVGMDPGDEYYDEPYFYVNMNPQPGAAQARMRPLWGRGGWHTGGWVGAVLPGSRLGSASTQEEQAREFIDSAISACRGLSIES